ncbi:MAG: leucyl/phenylalanyl-tRNA--protein transferase [Bacteroidetes bacterium]|nr:leucyl/phenylalanyl-tRNA--protein transferase [Bacteroidota bacterium]
MKDDMLSVNNLVNAYSNGYFPMADENGKISWYCPDIRAIFPFYNLKQKHSVIKFIEKNNINFTIDSDFEFVIRQCANREETWISDEIINAYLNLFENGYAHSIETWCNNEIIGGLYGVSINSAFFGESMFSLVSNASKAAFYCLISQLKQKRFILLDSQFINHFTAQLGAIEISKDVYLHFLRSALNIENYFV